MPQEDNVIEFPTQPQVDADQQKANAVATYHYSAFRVGKDGQTTWFDGVASLDAPILTHQQYGGFKKFIADHYDVPERNLVIVSLVRQDTLNFEVPPVQEVAN